MFKSIQWKMVIIYFLLILLAMQVIGVYLLNSLEQYHLDNLSSFLDSQAQLISGFLERHLAESYEPENINDLIQEFEKQMGMELQEISVLNPRGNIITTTRADISVIGERMLSPEITNAMLGDVSKEIRVDSDINQRLKHMAFPVKNDSNVIGIVYLVASLENIDNTLKDIREILLTATALALVITGFLGFALARTITGPIQVVTSKAASLARGDFDQKIHVKSKDEIGQLTEMFNYLTLRLKDTLGEISNEKSKIEAILSYMADGVIAVNTDGEIIHINPRARELIGYDSFDNKDFQKVIGNINEELTLEGVFEHGKGEGKEIVTEIGASILRAHFASFKNEKGETIGVVIVLRDVTEQERLEKMRKEFVANVSHEIKTPITTIKSYVETLMDGAVEDKKLSESFLKVIMNETDRTSRLVSDLLQLSKLDYQQTKWDKKPLSIKEITEEVISKLGVRIEQKNMTIKTLIEENLPKIIGDRDRIEQVITNIVGNAIKYTQEGGVINIYGENVNGIVVIKVKDNGIGIPAEDLPRVFERFYRVDKARSRDLGGTGLGLSIAKQIIEAHSGKIEINSEYGKGTEITITFKTANS